MTCNCLYVAGKGFHGFACPVREREEKIIEALKVLSFGWEQKPDFKAWAVFAVKYDFRISDVIEQVEKGMFSPEEVLR